MKRLFILLIDLYQKTKVSTHFQCRFIPTCSEYTKIAIERFGVIKGSYLGVKRILKCQPGGKSGIDLVPERNEK